MILEGQKCINGLYGTVHKADDTGCSGLFYSNYTASNYKNIRLMYSCNVIIANYAESSLELVPVSNYLRFGLVYSCFLNVKSMERTSFTR